MSVPPFREAGSGPAIVLLHGWTSEGAAFEGQMARLSDRFRCIAPDLPGHGRARGMTPGIAESAAAVAALLEALAVENATLVGWSMGAAVGWRLLSGFDAGRRVARMMSVDMSPKVPNGPGWTLGMKGQDAASCAGLAARVRLGWEGGLAEAIAAGMFAEIDPESAPEPPETAALHAEAAETVRAQEPERMARAWESLIAEDAREAVASCPVPLLAVRGARSRVYPPETADWIARTAPRGTRRDFPRSGHAPHLEEPDAFAATLAAFAAT